MKKELFIFFIFLLSVNFVSATTVDVVYVLKNPERADSGFMQAFDEMGLSVELIDDDEMPFTDFGEYKFIFIGDERLKNIEEISENKYSSVVANHYYGKEFELLNRGGISRLAANSPLKIKKQNNEIKTIEVYTKSNFKIGGVNIPYYYIPKKYKNENTETIATTLMGYRELGDVISYSTDSETRKCFFGITKTKFWTNEAKELFKDCVMFVLQKPETENIHDVVLDESFENSIDGIRIEDKTSGQFLAQPIILKMCNDYEFRIKLKNTGDFTENVTIIGNISSENFSKSWTENKENLNSGSYTTISGKYSENFCSGYVPGNYNLKYEAVIETGDENPGDNIKEIEFELAVQEQGNETENETLIHDISIAGDYSNSVGGIRIKNLETNEYLINETSQLMCSKKYTVSYKTINLGNFTENITFIGTIANFNWTSAKENLEPGDYTTAGSKTINISFSPGTYSIEISAKLGEGITDFNPLDNSRSRNVEVVCG